MFPDRCTSSNLPKITFNLEREIERGRERGGRRERVRKGKRGREGKDSKRKRGEVEGEGKKERLVSALCRKMNERC